MPTASIRPGKLSCQRARAPARTQGKPATENRGTRPPFEERPRLIQLGHANRACRDILRRRSERTSDGRNRAGAVDRARLAAARATHAEIRLNTGDGRVRFEIVDDGVGFDVATTNKGSGLTNMVDRLDALGGEVQITSSLGTGTRVRGSLPVVSATVAA
jgi:hypothetical protein